MPFRSKAQERFLFAKHPDIAKRWAAVTPNPKALPEHVARASARRLRKMAMARGNKQRAEVEQRHPFKNEPSASGPQAQPGQYKRG